MKHLSVTLCIMLLSLLPMAAQTVKTGENAIVYAFPHTSIFLDVEYEVCEQHAGPLADYAHLLGMDDAVTESDTLYRFLSVSTGIHTTADTNRHVTVLPIKGFQPQLIALDRRGILAGYNISMEEDNPGPNKQSTPRPRQETPKAMPLSEEALAATGEERAEIVRQQILHLREARTFLLLGESESQPADGEQLELLLREIHNEEIALTSLFTGSRTYSRKTRRIYFTPTSDTETILCRFSASHGIVDADAEGTPLRIITIMQRPVQQEPVTTSRGKKAPQHAIYYNLPGSCDYTLYFGDNQLLQRSISIAQTGVAVPLSLELLTPSTHIRFNTRTGNIISITQ